MSSKLDFISKQIQGSSKFGEVYFGLEKKEEIAVF